MSLDEVLAGKRGRLPLRLEELVRTADVRELGRFARGRRVTQLRIAGFIQATHAWYHPDHWQWAPWAFEGAYTGERKRAREERFPVRGRFIIRDEAYRPRTKDAQRWMKGRTVKRKTKAYRDEVAVIAGAKDLLLVREALAYAVRHTQLGGEDRLRITGKQVARLVEIGERVLLRAALSTHPKLEEL